MTRSIKGFQKGHRLNIGNSYAKGHTPWNKGISSNVGHPNYNINMKCNHNHTMEIITDGI